MAVPRSLMESSGSKATFSKTICSLMVYRPTQVMAGPVTNGVILEMEHPISFPSVSGFFHVLSSASSSLWRVCSQVSMREVSLTFLIVP